MSTRQIKLLHSILEEECHTYYFCLNSYFLFLFNTAIICLDRRHDSLMNSSVTDPYLNLFRGIIPPLGGTLDLSPIIAFTVLNVFTSSAAALPCEMNNHHTRGSTKRTTNAVVQRRGPITKVQHMLKKSTIRIRRRRRNDASINKSSEI